MVEHYNLGKAFAAKYPHLVSSGYDSNEVYVVSSSSTRCIESSMVHVSSVFRGLTSTLGSSSPAGLQDSLIAKYGPLLPASESSRGNYVPVKVYVATTGTDNLIFKGNSAYGCPSIQTYLDENAASDDMKQGWSKFQAPVQQANAYLSGNQKITNLQVLTKAYDAFISDIYDSKTLPGGISDINLVESLGYGRDFYLYTSEQKQEAQRGLTAFNTLQGIMDQLYNFRQGNNAKKLVFMGGHDSNIYAMLSSFGVLNTDCILANYEAHQSGQTLSYPNCRFPEFTSNLIFEFYNDTSNPYVKVYSDDVIVPLCNGQNTCSYDDFMAFMRTASGSESRYAWDTKCGNNEEKNSLNTGAKVGIILGALAGASLMIGLSIGIWVFLKKKVVGEVVKSGKVSMPKEFDNSDEIV